MPHDCKGCETALGNLAIISEKSTTRTSRKLDAVKPRSDDAFFMLAAFCFDLSRKMNYFFRATREFGLEADPDLARLVLEDNEAINANGLTWEERARAAEAIMIRSVYELGEEHERLLAKVAEGTAQREGRIRRLTKQKLRPDSTRKTGNGRKAK
jgi:hypothetical protein